MPTAVIAECLECGNELPPKKPGRGRRRLYCNPTCRGKAEHRRVKPLVTLNCIHCDDPFVSTESGRRRFCSAECRVDALYAQRRQSTRKEQRSCVVCGTPFMAWTNQVKVNCSTACYKRANAWLDRRNSDRVCPCGTVFKTRVSGHRTAKYCSERCRSEALSASRSARARELWSSAEGLSRRTWPQSRVFPGTCEQCDRVFMSQRARTRWCSSHCEDAARVKLCECGKPREFAATYCTTCRIEKKKVSRKRRRQLENELGLRRGTHYQRAKQFGVAYEPVDKARVFTRDKWRCQLCGKRVIKALKWPHPLSASLDHVIPMSLGGPHWYANVQLAHLQCNVKKGAKACGEQLALIG